MAEKRVIDWDAIERDYRQGIKTLREMADIHNVSHVAITKHAKKFDWTRDLSAKIKAENERNAKREKREEERAIKARGKIKLQAENPDEFDSQGFLYVIYLDDSADERYYKIGMAKSFNARFSAHQCSSPFDICVALAYFVGNMRAEEGALHTKFADKRIRGEWYKLDQSDLELIAKRSLLCGS